MTNTTSNSKKKADQYNDPNHNYLKYWTGREYENASEEMAIRRFLKGKHFNHAIDIGGGFGRLSIVLKEYADRVTLAEPSQQQLDIAADYLKDYPEIDRMLLQADDLRFADGSVDLAIMIRVMHHLPDPSAELKEIARVLSTDGYLILEFANYTHGQNRLKYMFQGKKLPLAPVDIRSEKNKKKDEIPFVNHNPRTVIKQLAHAGLSVDATLSVSNLRSQKLKKFVPRRCMLALERLLQPILAKTYFGPSVFLLVRKASISTNE